MGEGRFSRPWSGTALRDIVPATGLRGSWSRLWSEMCLHTCDQPPGGWLFPLVNSPAEPSTWTLYRNTISAAPGFSLFQLKFFNSLHLIGLFVANKRAAQGGAEGVLPPRSWVWTQAGDTAPGQVQDRVQPPVPPGWKERAPHF